MKTKSTYPSFGIFRVMALAAGLFAATSGASAQSAADMRYFRIAGPVPTRIRAFGADGTLVWTNTPTNTTFTVQTASALAGGTNNWVDYVQIPVTNGVNTNRVIDYHSPSGMALSPAGSFPMGDNFGDGAAQGWTYEVPVHTVYVSAFYMDKYDVTEALWAQVYNWATNHGYSFDYAGSVPGSAYSSYSKGPNYPVVIVDWYDCVKWCNARSEMEGKIPAYYTTSAQTVVYRTGQVIFLDNNSVKWGSGYRLATEAEWEKAARGGAGGQRFPWGNTITESQANYYADPSSYAYDMNSYSGYNTNYARGRSPVGSFAPNGYGLYEMADNVWQWCWDWWDGSWYSNAGATQSDTHGPLSGSIRVLRGGTYYSLAIGCRTANRYNRNPGECYYGFGFRSVLPPGQ